MRKNWIIIVIIVVIVMVYFFKKGHDDFNSWPWPHGKYEEPNIIDRSMP